MIPRHLLFLILSLLPCLGVAQPTETFPGTELPLTIQPSDLTADHRPLKLKEQSSGIFGDYYSSYSFQLGSLGLGSSANNERMQALFEILPVAWTKSDTVRIYGQEFLVTYILEPPLDQLREFSQGQPLKSTRLKLKLMKTDQIGSIEPFPELNREKYLAILGRLSRKGEPVAPLASRSMSLSNIKLAAVSLILYSGDHDDVLPYVHSSKTLLRVAQPYSKSLEVWRSQNPRNRGEWRFNMSLSGTSMAEIPEPANTPMLYDPAPWPDGQYLVAFSDGSARFVSPERWQQLQKNLRLKLKRYGKPIK